MSLKLKAIQFSNYGYKDKNDEEFYEARTKCVVCCEEMVSHKKADTYSFSNNPYYTNPYHNKCAPECSNFYVQAGIVFQPISPQPIPYKDLGFD